jgi:hypothetical protein
MSLPRLPPLAQPEPYLRLVIDFYTETADFQKRARTWWQGVNPWRLKPIRKNGTMWYTIGCAYRWSLYLDILRDEAAASLAYKHYQARLNDHMTLEARHATELQHVHQSILSLQPGQHYQFDGHQYACLPTVTGRNASTAHEHVCCACLTILPRPELQRPGQPATWFCATCDDEPSSMYEFVWRSIGSN